VVHIRLATEGRHAYQASEPHHALFIYTCHFTPVETRCLD